MTELDPNLPHGGLTVEPVDPVALEDTAMDLAVEADTDDEPESWDPLDALTIAELDAGSRLLKASLVKAMAEHTEDYEKAMAVTAYLHARRHDRTTPPAQLLERYTAMRYSELTTALLAFRPEPSPTTPGPS